ncbi:hypothetical protein pEaSNUABM38_00009 [Erwinia phage pEa_SNUABM_38]|nr:hypothetical protein pEaSNUABM38_00009 [Erwinia phage pEa_SNUABM_38]
MTVDMLNCALFHTFKSVEAIVGFTPEELLAKHINPELLFEMMQANGEARPVRHVVVKTVRSQLFDPTAPLMHVPDVIVRRPEDVELAYMAFNNAFLGFRDQIELMIRRVLGDKFNRYAIAELSIVADAQERVRALNLKIHGDIRHKFYMEQFPDGRFNSGKGGGH